MQPVHIEPNWQETPPEYVSEKPTVLHPFDALCFECTLPDCTGKSKECLQRKVLGSAPEMTAYGWNKKTRIMEDAGLGNLVDDVVVSAYRNGK